MMGSVKAESNLEAASEYFTQVRAEATRVPWSVFDPSLRRRTICMRDFLWSKTTPNVSG
jgi:hypothetical protein